MNPICMFSPSFPPPVPPPPPFLPYHFTKFSPDANVFARCQGGGGVGVFCTGLELVEKIEEIWIRILYEPFSSGDGSRYSLVGLKLLSIENKLARKLTYDDIVEDFV